MRFNLIKPALMLPLFTAAIQLAAQTTEPDHFSLISEEEETLIIRISPSASELISSGSSTEISVQMQGATQILKAGYPDLPKLTASVIIPNQKEVEVTIVSSTFTEIQNVDVSPSKGTLPRTINRNTAAVGKAEVYEENVFWPKNLAELREPYILRDFRGATLIIYPVQYNALTSVLRIYSEITVRISPTGNGQGINALFHTPSEKVPLDFQQIYQSHFLNYSQSERYIPLEEEGNMLIISHGQFINSMQPFVDWKNQKGIKTEMIDVASIGNNETDIAAYVSNYFTDQGLTFLLLVGDDDEVKSSSSSAGDSDNEYGYLLGNDHYQEIFVGRISAETISDVENQVEKILAYEKTPLASDYYSKAVGIASNQGPGDDGEMDFEHEQNIRTELLNYYYTDVFELYDGSQGGNDAPGNPDDDDLADLVNAGLGLINYTGHGSTTSIATTGFNNTDVDNLSNTDHWPLLWIVGCVTGNFTNSTCFAEAWARANDGGLPAGGLSSMMSTINQYWDEPMEAQDEMNFILTEAYTENIKRSFGGISINGCFSMNDAYGNSGYDMTDTWVLFGDPSLTVRTRIPESMIVSHPATAVVGQSQFEVSCNVEGALVCISFNNLVYATGKTTGGVAMLTFSPLQNADTMLVTVTAYNQIPYQTKVPVNVPAGPYVIITSQSIDDASGNNNAQVDYAEQVAIDLTLQNVGLTTAGSVAATLLTTDPSLTILDNTEVFGNINPSATSTVTGAFSFLTSDDVVNGHVALFTVTLADDLGNTWNNNFSIQIHAPELSIAEFTIDDASGNNNGYLDPGETALLLIENRNTGNSETPPAIGVLTSMSAFLNVTSGNYSLGLIPAGGNPVSVFTVQVAPETPYGLDAEFSYEISAGEYEATANYTTVVHPAIETFESGTLTQFEWMVSGDADWFTSTQQPYEGLYCTESGDIGNSDNTNLIITITALQDDEISFYKKVSSEGNYDYLRFYMDDVEMDNWSGEVEWGFESYSVTAGEHTFKWRYDKDNYYSVGEDCAWLDNILLPVFEQNPVGINESGNSSNQIQFFPNPAVDFAFISYQLTEGAVIEISLYNALGHTVHEVLKQTNQSAGNYQVGFNTGHLSAGEYFCRIQVNTSFVVKPVVITH